MKRKRLKTKVALDSNLWRADAAKAAMALRALRAAPIASLLAVPAATTPEPKAPITEDLGPNADSGPGPGPGPDFGAFPLASHALVSARLARDSGQLSDADHYIAVEKVSERLPNPLTLFFTMGD